MCGIFAYNGKENSLPILLEWLRNLEYRGYDSAWIVWVNKNWKVFLEKAVWKVSNLATKVEKHEDKEKKYSCWIAHTRWATHGWVTEYNSHPHYSSKKRFFVVHNWIIENYMHLKAVLQKKWYEFYSDTDTEVIAKLLEDLYDWNLLSTVEKVIKQLVWAYAIAVVDSKEPETLIWAKLGSPIIVWIWESGVFLSSDLNAISKVADEFINLEDHEIVKISKEKFNIFSFWEEVERDREKVTMEYQAWEIWDFETFTEKEIFEIPEAFKNALKWRINFESKEINSETLEELNTYDIERVEIIASWWSYFVWLTSTYWMRELAWLPCEVRISSEFLYDTFIPNKKTLYIFISQSGETADVRECVKIVKEKDCLTFWVINGVGSTIARMCETWLYTHSWVEVWVASTKATIWQMAVMFLLALNFWIKRDLQMKDARNLITHLQNLPEKLQAQLEHISSLEPIIEKYSKYEDFFFLWRNFLYWTAQESALKLKELSYLHSECYSTWELKHWPLALIWPNFPCVVLNPKWVMFEKTLSNVKEIQARNAPVLWVITTWDLTSSVYDDFIEVPEVHRLLTPFVCLVPMWIMAVWIAKKLWRDIDKPQNLAKSVTVE